MAYASLAVASWSGYFILAKLVLNHVEPITFGWLRFGIGGIVLLILAKSYREKFKVQSKKEVLLILASGLIGVTIHQWTQITGLQTAGATNAVWILALTPSVTAIMAWLLLKERLRAKQIIGLCIASLAVILMISNGDLRSLSLINNWGDVLIASGLITWSLYTILCRTLAQRHSTLWLSAIQMGIGFLSFSLMGAKSIPTDLGNLTTQDWIIMLIIGIFMSGLAYAWWNKSLKWLNSTETSMFLFIEPVLTTVLAVPILNEPFTWLRASCMAAILWSVVWAVKNNSPRQTQIVPEKVF